MRGRWWRTGLTAVVGGFMAIGCEKAIVKPNYPPDPVLLSKKPIEGKPGEAAQVVASIEPQTPALPETALASAPRGLSNAARVTAAKVPLTASADSSPIGGGGPPIPTVETRAPTAAVTGSARPVAGTYGHGPDHSWLQGVIDRHYSGHIDLRFCDAAVEDDWGGKVCLADDPRLQSLKDGDVVFVEGVLESQAAPPGRRHGNQYPVYRIKSVEMVQHKP